ncbi:heavy-metal-associated domain-containing protein [Flavobacterium crassostreae]|uniref:Heavy metal transporter n=1 Tax=Flavobacterium crassostreae TaxID=1763534 RepID=A0A1B9E4J7_9FLAO|nr:heavy metal-associated domain-containing protein [Flavobacterium crassostreae]OCB76866.1 heavy metal transporter [Flavobacterium crassostreae]
MKITKAITAVALASLLFVSCKKNTPENTATTNETPKTTEAPKIKKDIAPQNLQTASFSIEGMTCAVGCAKTIQEELIQLEGVQTAAVDFETKQATVRFDKTIQNPETLTQTVQASGDGKTYTVTDMKS